MDNGRQADPKEKKQDLEFVLGTDALTGILAALAKKGYLLVGHRLGQFSGFRVYRKVRDVLPGLVAPEDYYAWREIYPEDEIPRRLFLETWRSVLEDLIMASGSDDYRVKLYRQYLREMYDTFRNVKNGLCDLAKNQWGDQNNIERVSLNGTSGTTKVVPKREWFPEALRDYDARRLLTLFPEPEADMLMLILGRTVAGAKETLTAEGYLQHTARAFGLIVGLDPGMGKSTLMGFIRSALVKLGFKVEMINTSMGKFGWGRIAQSDLAFVDDLTDETQERLIKSELVKSIVSGDTLKVEEKGQDSYNTRAFCTVLACTNITNYQHYLKLDAGTTNRLNQLYTYCQWELDGMYGTDKDYRTLPFWKEEARRLGVSTDLLAAYLLREALDYFLDVTGYSFDSEGQLVKDDNADRLEEVTKEDRAGFRIDTSLKHVEELVETCLDLVALAIADNQSDPKKAGRVNSGFERLDFSPQVLLPVLDLFVANPKLPFPWDRLNLKELSWSCRDYLKAKITDLGKLAPTKSMDQAFKIVVGELRSRKGFGYPQGLTSYTSVWMANRIKVKAAQRHWVKALEEHEVPDVLQEVIEDLAKTIMAMA